MKVMQIIPDLGMGGAEVMCTTLSIELTEAGHEVIVISLYSDKTPLCKVLGEKAIKVIYLNKHKGIDPKVIYRLVRVLREESPKVIHTHLYALKYAMIAAIFAGIEVRVHTIHNIAIKEANRWDRKFAKILFKHFRVIPVALSNLVKATVMQEYGIKEDKIPIVHNGVKFPENEMEKTVRDDGCLKLIHIGRFTEQKNHKMLLTAYKALIDEGNNIRLSLVGDGELRPEIERIAVENGIRDYVEFCGIQKNVYKYLKEADILILPSIWEGMPMVIIEAMGAGVPIIATNVGGIPDMIRDGYNGLLIGNDVNELIAAVKRLADDKELREKMGENARKESANFTSKKMADEYLKIYLCAKV